MRTAPGKEDQESPLLRRISSSESPASEIAGLHGKTAARKPLLRTGNKQKRLVWAEEHKEWTLDQWKSVLWSDESKFEIFGSNHRVFVRRRKGERMDSTCLVPTVKHGGGGGVMVWVCFASDTVADLFKIEGILNQHGYHSILQRHAIPFGWRLVGPSFIFQQDNDPNDLTSRLCKGYLTKKESDGVLRQMTWPPQSLDLNPIEMVWGHNPCAHSLRREPRGKSCHQEKLFLAPQLTLNFLVWSTGSSVQVEAPDTQTRSLST
ncbi:hypothetical protein SRHO_G00317510 [Serrasalmus rhombeus]